MALPSRLRIRRARLQESVNADVIMRFVPLDIDEGSITFFKIWVIKAQEGLIRLNADAELLVGLALDETAAELHAVVLGDAIFGECLVVLVCHFHTDFSVMRHLDRANWTGLELVRMSANVLRQNATA